MHDRSVPLKNAIIISQNCAIAQINRFAVQHAKPAFCLNINDAFTLHTSYDSSPKLERIKETIQ